MSASPVSEPAERLSDIDIALYALYLLGGWQKRVHTEDVALRCFRLAPTKFSLAKYPRYPDLTPARHALEDAKKAKYGRLVKGASERMRSAGKTSGWMFTPEGMTWLEAHRDRIERVLGKGRPTGDRLPAERRIRDLRNSRAFAEFLSDRKNADVSHAEFAESLVCTVNSPASVLNERLDQLATIAEQLHESDVAAYVDFCRHKFADLLSQGGRSNV